MRGFCLFLVTILISVQCKSSFCINVHKSMFIDAFKYFCYWRGMKGPHGHDLFMSCISELVLETREVSTVFQKINFFFFGSKHKCQSSFLGCWCMCCSAMYCPVILGSIGHFRVPKTLTFKLRPSAQPFLCKWVLSAWEWKIIPISKAEHLTSFWYSVTGNQKWLIRLFLPLVYTHYCHYSCSREKLINTL